MPLNANTTPAPPSTWQIPFWFAIAGFCLGLLNENLAWLYTDDKGQYTTWLGLNTPIKWALTLSLVATLFVWKARKCMAAPVYLAILLALATYAGFNAQLEFTLDDTGYVESDNFMTISTPFLLSAIVFITLPFVQAWEKTSPHWQYPTLFAYAWNNTHTLLLAAGFALASFLTLFFGTILLGQVGLKGESFNLTEFINTHVFIILLTTGSAAIGIIQQYNSVLLRLHMLAFALYRLLAYAAAIITLLFIINLLPNVSGFLREDNAAFTLLILVGVGILLLNTLVEYGSVNLNPLANALFLVYTATLPILTSLAIYIIAQRVQHYGLSPARMTALLAGMLLLVYNMVYLAQWVRYRNRWSEGLKSVNPPLALLAATLMFLLLTPILSPQDWSSRQQLSRLQNGKVSAQQFDYYYLRHDFGKAGVEAIETLKTWKDHPQHATIISQIQSIDFQAAPPLPPETVEHINIVPATKRVDLSLFMNVLQHLPQTHPFLPSYCLEFDKSKKSECFLLFTDINADQKEEAVLVTLDQFDFKGKMQYTVDAIVMKLDSNGLPTHIKSLANATSRLDRKEDYLTMESQTIPMTAQAFTQVRQALLAGQLTPVMPELPDLTIAGQRLYAQ